MNTGRADIAYQIAEDLLNNDALDLNNFCNDTDAILQLVQRIILTRLKDYLIVFGNVI